MPEHILVRLDRRRHLAGLNLLKHRRIDKVRHHKIAQRLPEPHLPDDALHAEDAAAPREPRVLIVVHREFYEQQVDPPLGQHMVAEPERPRLRVGRRDPGVDEFKLGVGKPCLQPVADHRPVAVHLRDRPADERDAPGLFLLKLDARVLQSAAQFRVAVGLCPGRLAKPEREQKNGDKKKGASQLNHAAADAIAPPAQAQRETFENIRKWGAHAPHRNLPGRDEFHLVPN